MKERSDGFPARLRAVVAVVALASIVGANYACGAPGEDGRAPENARLSPPSANLRPDGLYVLRPRTKFGAREAVGGTAFIVKSRPVVAVMSSHLVLFGAKAGTLEAIELVDARSLEVLARSVGLAAKPGPAFSGLDYSGDFGLVLLDVMPAGVSVAELSGELPRPGEAVEILACPPDGSGQQTVIAGQVMEAGALKLEIGIKMGTQTRAMAGSPVFSTETGHVVGILQNVVTKGGQAVVLATPAKHIRAALASCKTDKPPVPLSAWTSD